MTSFIIDESHLNRLSPKARQEVLAVLRADLDELEASFLDSEWAPDRDTSYPLTVEDARVLIRGVAGAGEELLRVFALNYDGETGRASLQDLLEATGHTDYQHLGQDISTITQSLRSITGNSDAWLFNWRQALGVKRPSEPG